MEAIVITGVAGKTSPVTTASYLEFGDSFLHAPWTAAYTLTQLKALEDKHDPNEDFISYIKAAKEKYCLNGVNKPFWCNWPMAEPAKFLTTEPLHQWHKFFWDHIIKWCCNALEAQEIDFQFSILHPHVGFHRFKEGISKLKQVTSREHRNVQWYLIGVIAGDVSREFLVTVWALQDFWYLGQAPESDDGVNRATDKRTGTFQNWN